MGSLSGIRVAMEPRKALEEAGAETPIGGPGDLAGAGFDALARA